VQERPESLTDSERAERDRRLKAIGLMCAATVSFSILDATAKYLVDTESLPVSQVVWLRFVWHVVLSAAILWAFSIPPSFLSKKPGIQVLRALFMLGATAGNFLAVKYLQLDQTITIFFLTPLLVAALSGPLLGEWVGWRRLMAIGVGFTGVLLVMQPGFGGIHWAVFFALGATASYALYNISTRYLAAHDPAEVTQSYSPLAGLLIMLPFALMQWEWPESTLSWALLVSLGFWGGLGHWLLILAHRAAPAPVLAPFVYTGLISMSVLGYLIFGDIPTFWTLAGGAVVILCGLYLFARERQIKARAVQP
jgi:drug/metabolite transporter (DMT)-like permease